MDMNRRLLVAALLLAPIRPAGWLWRSAEQRNMTSWTPGTIPGNLDTMRYRELGASGIKVSEVGFGSMQIGRKAYGNVERDEVMRMLARAEELGCNFIDTASVYGDAEQLIGEFLQGRRDRWLISTKYSGQADGLEATLEKQLKTMNTEVVDFYMIHWVPSPRRDPDLYEALYRMRKAGKARLVGLSLYNINDIRTALNQTEIDGFMVPFNLVSPDPLIANIDLIREKRPAVIVRGALHAGLLTGKYGRDHRFSNPGDERHSLTAEKIAAVIDTLEDFRFLEEAAGSIILGALRYPLAWTEVSTVVIGTRTLEHVEVNFGQVSGRPLPAETLHRIEAVQKSLGVFDRSGRLKDTLRRLLG